MDEPDALFPAPPAGWQYGVVMADGTVWGCGTSEHGRWLQRRRLSYSNVSGPCLLPGSADLNQRHRRLALGS